MIDDVCHRKEVSVKWKKIASKLHVAINYKIYYPTGSSDEIKLKRVFDEWKANRKPPFNMATLLNVLKEVDASNVACQLGEC